MRHEKNERRYPRFRSQLFVLLTVFIAVMLCLLWVFQIGLLRPMYEAIKLQELRRISVVLSETVGKDGLGEISETLAKRTNICISVYRIVGQSAVLQANAHIESSCFIHNVTSDITLNRMYAGARENGYYTEELTDSFFGQGEESAHIPKNILASRLAQDDAGQHYLILLNAEIEPVGTTMDALRIQLGIISVLLLVGAAIAAVITSARMSRPLTQMSREAKKLALGTYDVHFEGGYSRETEELAQAYRKVGTELGAEISPVGTAFAHVLVAHPEIELYDPDMTHPSLAGSYLAALCHFTAAYGESPLDIPFTAGLEAQTAAILQQAAHDILLK